MDEFERRIRAARPASVRRDTPLSSRAKRELAELILSDPDASLPPARSSAVGVRRRSRGVAGGALATVLVAAIAVVAVVLNWPVYAATPELLATAPVSVTASEALLRASVALREVDTGPGDGEGVEPGQAGVISAQTWTLASTDDGSRVTSAVVPENYVITRNEDGSRTVVVTAGQALDGDAPDSDVEDGALLWEESYAAGEYAYSFTSPAPTSADEVGTFLGPVAGADTDSNASAAFQSIAVLLMEQTLAPHQEAALLEYLAGLPGVEMIGSTNDRLGRPALVLSTTRTDGEYEDHILISPDQGVILATETIYTGTERTDLRSPAVVSYYAWNRN